MTTKLGIAPGISDSGSSVPGFLQSSMQISGGNSVGNVQRPVGNIMQSASKTTESTLLDQKRDGSLHTHSKHESLASNGTPDVALGSHSEKVISSFLQNPILKTEDTELGDMVCARSCRLLCNFFSWWFILLIVYNLY